MIKQTYLTVWCLMTIWATVSNAQDHPLTLSEAGIKTKAKCEFDCLKGTGDIDRKELNQHLLRSSNQTQLIDFKHFSIPKDAANPTNHFSGTLKLSNVSTSGNFESLKDEYEYLRSNKEDIKHLPDFEFQFLQHGTHIIPKLRGAIPSNHPNWEYILEPGRVWNERQDKELSRVSLPFTLQEKNENCMHNGVLSFVFDQAGKISQTAYQIASETCKYFQFNMWGLLPSSYQPESLIDRHKIISDYEREVANRMLSKPISALKEDFPKADPSQFGSPEETAPASVSVFGFVISMASSMVTPFHLSLSAHSGT